MQEPILNKINNICRYYFLLIFIFFFSCIDKIDLGVKEGAKRFVVDGQITDEEGSHYIKLSQTTNYGIEQNYPVSGAKVTITDNIGNLFEFKEAYSDTVNKIVDKGTYKIDKFKGVPGRTYILTIETGAKKYISDPELLKASPPLENIYYEKKVKTTLNDNKEELKVSGFDFFVDTNDPSETEDYYRWQYQAIYQVETQPSGHVKYNSTGDPIPDPKDCCMTCWVTENDFSFNVSDDALAGGSIDKHHILFVPFYIYFQIKYRLEVRQYLISKKAYDYFDEINKLVSNTGTIFDRIPSRIKGNITNPDDEKEIVLGFFSAAGVSKKTIFVTWREVNERIKYFEYPDDCRELNNSTTQKPQSW